ncbi:hypothetical protein Q9L58_005852 [Maublancomyces gigas]|uniref:ZZ-type domain-containing protein n=1 Tax=Discina gigas TaxID=1032678 RepID=A0ABR3GH70_9PEZI
MNPIATILNSILPYRCDGCGVNIVSPNQRFNCVVCPDYDSCECCQATSTFTAPHLNTHRIRILNVFAPPPPPAASFPQPDGENRRLQSTDPPDEYRPPNDATELYLEAAQHQQMLQALDSAHRSIMQGLLNAGGGWRIDSNGRRVYQEGYTR